LNGTHQLLVCADDKLDKNIKYHK